MSPYNMRSEKSLKPARTLSHFRAHAFNKLVKVAISALERQAAWCKRKIFHGYKRSGMLHVFEHSSIKAQNLKKTFFAKEYIHTLTVNASKFLMRATQKHVIRSTVNPSLGRVYFQALIASC